MRCSGSLDSNIKGDSRLECRRPTSRRRFRRPTCWQRPSSGSTASSTSTTPAVVSKVSHVDVVETVTAPLALKTRFLERSSAPREPSQMSSDPCPTPHPPLPTHHRRPGRAPGREMCGYGHLSAGLGAVLSRRAAPRDHPTAVPRRRARFDPLDYTAFSRSSSGVDPDTGDGSFLGVSARKKSNPGDLGQALPVTRD